MHLRQIFIVEGVTFKQWLTHELAMWRGLFICIKGRKHFVVYGGKNWTYCWTCFHQYPWQSWIGVTDKIRNFFGLFAKWEK
jgi:hypothetical protein